MRQKTVKVSKQEKEQLNRAREDIFESENVPYGEVINRLVEEYYES